MMAPLLLAAGGTERMRSWTRPMTRLEGRWTVDSHKVHSPADPLLDPRDHAFPLSNWRAITMRWIWLVPS
jgi:hypothetical protein